MQLEDLRIGADVMSSDGRKLGSLSRIVVTKDTLTVTHVVVDTGILRSGEPLWKGGWSLSYDRVIPLGVLGDVRNDAVDLTMSADEFRDLSVDYDEEYWKPMPDMKPGVPDTSDFARLAASIPGEPGPWVMADTLAKDPSEADIPKDAAVWRMNPHEKIGEVEHVIFDEDTNKVASLVIRRGFLFTHEVLLPAARITEIIDSLGGIVRVDIDDAALKSLERYDEKD